MIGLYKKKTTKGRAGIRWDNVVEKIWKDLGGGQEEVLRALDRRKKGRKEGKG